MPVRPSVQAIKRAKPHAPVLGRQDGQNSVIRQPLLHGNHGDSEVAKAVEAITGGDPHGAFTILKEIQNRMALGLGLTSYGLMTYVPL